MSRVGMREDDARGYRTEVRMEEDGSWSLTVPSLPGLVVVGETFGEAWGEMPKVIDLWVEAARDGGQVIPPPDKDSVDRSYSGKLMLRMPRTLHAGLARLARSEGTSINMLCVTALTEAVSRRAETVSENRPRAVIEDFVVTEVKAYEGGTSRGVRDVLGYYEAVTSHSSEKPPKSITRTFSVDDKARHAN
ncbi:MAG: toxin-antitoxin system HicB family antitoxin [Candidatus Limnocylindria bacterium]